MRILQAEQLRRHLTGTLLPAYLVAGDEPLLVLEAADELRRAAMASGVGERLVFDVMAGFSWPEWRMEVRSFGLFATRRLIELRLPTPKLSAEGSAAVLEFLSEPGEDILLVQTSDWSKAVESLSWVRAIEESGALMPIWPLKIGELPNWIRQRANKLGVNLTDDGLAELASRVEGNLLAAHQELSKLALLAPGQSIDASRLVDLVADYARYDVFALFDAVTAGRASRVRRILAGLRRGHPSGGTSGLSDQSDHRAGWCRSAQESRTIPACVLAQSSSVRAQAGGDGTGAGPRMGAETGRGPSN